MQEPTSTWSTFFPAISFTRFTLSGLCGIATIGSSADRSMSITRSYFADGSALTFTTLLAALGLEERLRHLVGGEDRGGHAGARRPCS